MSHHQIDAMLVESGGGLDPAAHADLREGLGGLLVLVEDTAPTPSPELAALLGLPVEEQAGDATAVDAAVEGGSSATVLPLRRPAGAGHPRDRRLTGPRGAVTGAVVLAMATVGATGISAAANSLPAPLQRHVADLSRTYLPFDFPQPRAALDRDRAEGLPAPGDHDLGGGTPPGAVGEPSSDLTTDRDRALRPTRAAPDATVPRPARTSTSSPASPRTWTVRPGGDVGGDAPRETSAPGGTRSSTTTSSTTASKPAGGHDDAQHGRPRTRGGASDGSAPGGTTGSASAADSGAAAPRAQLDAPPPVLLAVPRPGRPVPSAPAPESGAGQGVGPGKSLGNGSGKGAVTGPDKGLEKGPDTAPSKGPDLAAAVDRVVGAADGPDTGG